MRASSPTGKSSSAPVLHVLTPDGRVFRFSEPFWIGRDRDCAVRLEDVHVSRKHIAVSFENGAWCVRDLKSANGMFVGDQRVEITTVNGTLAISLGIDGPSLSFEVEGVRRGATTPAVQAETVQRSASDTRLLASYEERYFGGGASQERVGGRTQMIRRAFERVQRKQRRQYWGMVSVLAVACLAAGGYAYYKHRQVTKLQNSAEALFYEMKQLDVSIARMERLIETSGNAEARAQARSYAATRRAMEGRYDEFVRLLNLYDARLSEEDRLILRVTRAFGECELAAPTEYMSLVKSYIRKWQHSERYAKAVAKAQQMGFAKFIADEFVDQNLPPQFFYLAMQESDFDPFIIGPPTYAGIAKGMWQFIPDTGQRYGLNIGPLKNERKADPADDRHHWQKATRAAARYIKDIYSTDAQASGLLVMASYNWGEGRVIKLLRSMPENPQERNFWELLAKYRTRVPQQTYDYVFYIVSAAVIGENPRLFGFDFDNPLGFVDKTADGNPRAVQ
jgi:hypothetical protein